MPVQIFFFFSFQLDFTDTVVKLVPPVESAAGLKLLREKKERRAVTTN